MKKSKYNIYSNNSNLTIREKDVLRLIADGLTSRQIAKKLYMSEHTVDTHRTNLRKKTGCKNAATLAVYAFKHGLIK